jgi:hypothetical protein
MESGPPLFGSSFLAVIMLFGRMDGTREQSQKASNRELKRESASVLEPSTNLSLLPAHFYKDTGAASRYARLTIR